MKRILAVMCVLALILSGGCSAKKASAKKENPEHFAIQKAVELAQVIDEMAENEELLEAYGIPEETMSIALSVGKGKYTKPNKAVVLSCDEDDIIDILSGLDLDIDALDEDSELIPYILRKGASAIATSVINRFGVSWLAVSSLLSVGNTFLAPKAMPEYAWVFLTYNDAASVIATFVTHDGITSVSAQVAPFDAQDVYEEAFDELDIDMSTYKRSEISEILG